VRLQWVPSVEMVLLLSAGEVYTGLHSKARGEPLASAGLEGHDLLPLLLPGAAFSALQEERAQPHLMVFPPPPPSSSPCPLELLLLSSRSGFMDGVDQGPRGALSGPAQAHQGGAHPQVRLSESAGQACTCGLVRACVCVGVHMCICVAEDRWSSAQSAMST